MSGNNDDDYSQDHGEEIFTQDGVLLKASIGRTLNELNTSGTLCIVRYKDGTKSVEWKPSEVITIDLDIQDQEWAVVDTIGRRTRTISGTSTCSENQSNAGRVKLNMSEIKSFRISRNNQQIQFSTRLGQWHSTFYFQHGNTEVFLDQLKLFLKTAKARHDKYSHIVIEPTDETQVLNRSFAELDLFSENTTDVVWNLVSNFKQRPYTTTMEAFSKLTDIGMSATLLILEQVVIAMYYGNEQVNGKRNVSEDVADLLSKSMNALEQSTILTKSDDYEVVNVKPTLPPRPSIPRGYPLSEEQWEGLKDPEGRLDEVEGVKQIIFRGGISSHIRHEVWKYLLDYYPWNITNKEKPSFKKRKTEEYYTMKLQWKTITLAQENRFSDFRDRKSLVEKDVNRTDRTHPYFAGDDNPNLVVLYDILMTYVMFNFDLGYVQGMSDILSPILALMKDEVDAFWCFVGFMEKIALNFDIDQAGMKNQLQQLSILLAFVSPELAQHLTKKDSGNMFFCFRWLLVWFKREFPPHDIMRLWEVLWTGVPCINFHLLVSVAILDSDKDVFIQRDYGFTEILKHVNELSMRLDVDSILSNAEGIYHQICASSHLTDQIRIILGMQPLQTTEHDPDDGNDHHNITNDVTKTNSNLTETDDMSNNDDMSSVSGGDSGDHKSILMQPEADEVVYQIGLDMNY